MRSSSRRTVRIRDSRHHAVPDPDHIRAEDLLCGLAERAQAERWLLSRGDTIRYHQRNREKFADKYANRPGAFIQERCTPAERSLLTKLVSNPHARLNDLMRFERHPGHPDNKICGVLEWSAPTVWKLGL